MKTEKEKTPYSSNFVRANERICCIVKRTLNVYTMYNIDVQVRYNIIVYINDIIYVSSADRALYCSVNNRDV